MTKIKEKEQARQLRKLGRSVNDIAKDLDVSKSTVSHWCRDIKMSPRALKKIAARGKKKSTLALLNYSERQRLKREEDIKYFSNLGAERVGALSDRDVFCIGLGLYWGEGYKQGTQEFGFTNSDPRMIEFYLRWLGNVFGVNSDQLILRVSINEAHKERDERIIKYWSRLTKVPRSQFTRTSFIKTNSRKSYSNSDQYFGTLRIKVRRGTNFRREVLGAISAIG